ncbi:MAG: hypothetical protein H6510_05300 [Acidobacteria bacterium]|nr:hypothetical protein [Acidobacteriota bacterium]MCB9397211.1 hypothetical protein [Acidobacteriota bacterium]
MVRFVSIMCLGLGLLAQESEAHFISPVGVFENSAGQVIVLQNEWSYGRDNYDSANRLRIFDASGNRVLDREFEGYEYSYPTHVEQDGDVLWIAFSYQIYYIWNDGESPLGKTDVLRINLLNGEVLQQFTVEGYLDQLKPSADGGFLATYLTDTGKESTSHLAKLSAEGQIIWDEVLGVNSNMYWIEKGKQPTARPFSDSNPRFSVQR